MGNKERYARQILLDEFGEAAQEKLLSAKVLVIGAGGLGCPALQYLVAAGVGNIGIVDFDVVDLTNLHRQVIYSMEDIGEFKALAAAQKLNALNPEIQIHSFNLQLTNKNALELISGYDLVLDGSDNFATRYLVNDTCVLLDKPLVYGAVLRFEGQVGVFNMEDNLTKYKTNYRDLFTEPPNSSLTISCNEIGVIGVLPGIIGTMQALEAIKIITGIGQPLCNKIISYNALNNLFYDFEVMPSNISTKLFPTTELEILNFNYDWFCNSIGIQISIDEFDTLRTNEKVTIIDIREKDELPYIDEFSHINIPLSEIETCISQISFENKIVVFCNSGARSFKALNTINKIRPNCISYSLKGGIEEWKKKNTRKIN